MTYIDLALEPISQEEDLWWIFYLQNNCPWETYQALLGAFRMRQVHLISEQVDTPKHPETFQAVLRDERCDVHVEILSPGDSSRLYLGVNAAKMLPPEALSARLNADIFLEYGKLCYHILKPLYAFAETLNTFIDEEAVKQHQLTHVCWAQFFGPNFVQGVGQERFMRAPAWRNENLENGGLLYVLAASPCLYQGAGQYWQQARDYFAHFIPTSLTWSDRMC